MTMNTWYFEWPHISVWIRSKQFEDLEVLTGKGFLCCLAEGHKMHGIFIEITEG